MSKLYKEEYEDEWGKMRELKQKMEHFCYKRLPGYKPGRLLDIGCGSGAYLAEMERKGWSVCGIDPWAGVFNVPKCHSQII